MCGEPPDSGDQGCGAGARDQDHREATLQLLRSGGSELPGLVSSVPSGLPTLHLAVGREGEPSAGTKAQTSWSGLIAAALVALAVE
jgi:hypothetical protein